MSFKTAKILLISALGACVFATTAQGQDMEEFSARMKDAAAATKVDMGEALRQYLEIRIQYAGPEVDYSLGRTYQRMNQCADAQHYYTQVMVAYNLPDDNPIYQRAVNEFDKIAPCEAWQKVKVECEMPVGGYALLDGERVTSCWDRTYSLSDGEHVFTLVSADGQKMEKKFKASTGANPETIRLAFPVEKVEVEKIVEVEHGYLLKEKFHPALYWGLIAGGAAFVAIGGFMSGYAGDAKVDEQKYADLYAISKNDENKNRYDKKRKDANDRVKVGNAVMYSMIGIGGAAIVTGAALAIVSALSDKERVELSDDGVNAFVTPTPEGVSLGLGMRF